jgi:hypothetical protein
MKILVAIASYGTNNDAYLARLLAEYGRLPHAVDVVVVSNIAKGVGAGVEVVVGCHEVTRGPCPLPTKTIFAQRLEDYDLSSIPRTTLSSPRKTSTHSCGRPRSWSRTSSQASCDSEEGPDGALHYSTIHNHYHWDVRSACRRQGETFVHFTNEHSACYLLTRDQLRRAIALRRLLRSSAPGPLRPARLGGHRSVHAVRVPQARLRVPASQIHGPHLTNKYIGRTGVEASLVELQVRTLIDNRRSRRSPARFDPFRPRLAGTRWIKSYYEPCREDLVALVPESARTVLSIGCGWGSTEEALLRKHLDVSAIPLDTVIGEVAATRGVRIIPWCLEAAPAHLAEASFDVLLIPGLLHLLDDPVAILRSYQPC